jgi:AmpD protein
MTSPSEVSPNTAKATLDLAGWVRPLEGWLDHAQSPHFNDRPDKTTPSLLVVHGISLPAGVFGGSQVDDLFMGRLLGRPEPEFADLSGLRVSAHFVIWRSGRVRQYVGVHHRAWHAGVSHFQGRDNCNDFSIGVELEGTDELPYETCQLDSLVRLMGVLRAGLPGLTWVAGHSDIAPGRKTDPGPNFPWRDLQAALPQDPTAWQFASDFS